MVNRTRHVLVYPAAANGDTRPDQGLLIDWQKRRDEWWANVAIVTGDGHLIVTWRHHSDVRAVESD